MIELYDSNKGVVFVDAANVALIEEATGSAAYHGTLAYVTLYSPPNKVLGVTQKAKYVADLVRKAKEPAAELQPSNR